MDDITIDEMAAETARRIRACEREHEYRADFDDIRLMALAVIDEHTHMYAYVNCVARKAVEYLVGMH